MAEEAAKKKPEGGDKHGDKHAEKPGGAEKKSGGMGAMLGKTPVMLGGVMILEAVVLFAGFKFLGGGANPAVGADLAEATAVHGSAGGGNGEGGNGAAAGPISHQKTVEVQVVEFRAPNKVSGRLLLIDVSIYMVVKTEQETSAKEILKAREALIKDRIRTIIAQSEPEKLGGEAEPGLETLRRQVKYQLDEIIGEGMVEEVLVPRCIPIRAD